jgi:polysaccharide deacetylase family sporulation protein PdaB
MLRLRLILCASALCALMGGWTIERQVAAHALAAPVYYIGTRTKAVALTFDVSWGDRMLPLVVATLRKEDVPATFFLSGPWARTHADAVRGLIADGFEIASHGQAHVNLGGLASSAVADNIGAADAILRGYTGKSLRFFRPPNGDFSARSVEVALGLGYETVIWSVDSRDWLNPGVHQIVSRVLHGVFPGAIVLLHASDTCRQTDLALPAIVQGLRAAGYRLVTLGALWQMGPPMHDDPRGRDIKPNMAAVACPPAAT